jgi:hypothetical protein
VERTHAFADGELTGAVAEEARDHLAACSTCRAELAELLQLDAMVADRREAVISLAWYRRRRVQLAAVSVVVAVAASAVIYFALPHPVSPVAPDAIAVVLAPHRALEARLAWPGAAAYRSYDVPRAGEPPHETIDLMSIAQLDRRGDSHGVGVLELLNGERRQAASHLERAGDSADVLADRAAIALADNQPERALGLTDIALEATAGHGPALWNRALALRDLGLSRASAAAFRAVVERGEPGWSTEAAQRAASLDAEADALEHRFERISHASVALARGEIELSADDARAMPGFARGILYDAIRSATTPDQLAALRPLGDAIDGADHDTAMADALARARGALHPALSRQYGEMIRSLAVELQIAPPIGDEAPVPSGAARAQLLVALRAAHADDLMIGVLMKTSKDRMVVDRGEIAEFARLTAASPDPWMHVLGLQQQAELALSQDDLTGAEAILVRARSLCAQPGAPGFRCVTIGRLLGELYLKWQRLPEARSALGAAWGTARASGEWLLQNSLLPHLATLASLGDEAQATGLPLVRAYTDEIVYRYPASAADLRCQNASWGRDLRAMLLVDRLQFDAARRELAGPACDGEMPSDQVAMNLFVRSELARYGGTAEELAALRREIAALRARPTTSIAERIVLDHAEGRAVIDRDPAAGAALLGRAIAAARAVPPSVGLAHKAAAWSTSVLVATAAQRGDGDAALAVLADEQHVALPRSCVLGLAVEDRRRTIVARDAAGKLIVHHDEARTSPAIDPATFVPPEVAAALAGCAVVDVIARPPLHGMARLLGDSIAWRYLSQRARPAVASGGRSVVVANVEPPAALELPRLATWSLGGETVSGAAATPSRVLAAIGAAGDVVVHAHGVVDVALPDASFLALSPEPDGRFALTTGDVRKARFATSPIVILAACRASQAAPVWHATWSLPAAFVYAGARAVIASAAPIPDSEAAAFFDAVRAKLRAGAPVAAAVRDVRQRWLAERRGDWVRDVIVFE